MARKNEVAGPTPASPYEAFRQAVYAFGVQDLAGFLGCATGTLYNKADAKDDTHAQPTMRDLILVTQLSGDFRILDSIESMFGRVAYNVTIHNRVSDQALLELLTALGKENGEFHAALHQGLMDRKFTRNEFNRVRAEAFDIVSALMTVITRLEGLIDDE